MQTVILDFQSRVQEVNQYFVFLEGLIQETTKLAVVEDNGEQKITAIDSDLGRTLKANAFLILYNLIESTMRGAIEAIFDEISSKKVSFDSVRIEIKKIVIHNFKNRSPDNIHSRIKDISLDIITAGFNSRELFSGNVDREEITNTARKYGFSFHTEDYTQIVQKPQTASRNLGDNPPDLAAKPFYWMISSRTFN